MAAILFGEPESERVVDWISGDPLVAPTLISYEVANTCWKKLLRHPAQKRQLMTAYGLFPKMAVQPWSVALGDAILLAESERLTVYDASYLWLARRLGIELVTLDQELLAASRRSA